MNRTNVFVIWDVSSLADPMPRTVLDERTLPWRNMIIMTKVTFLNLKRHSSCRFARQARIVRRALPRRGIDFRSHSFDCGQRRTLRGRPRTACFMIRHSSVLYSGRNIQHPISNYSVAGNRERGFYGADGCVGDCACWGVGICCGDGSQAL